MKTSSGIIITLAALVLAVAVVPVHAEEPVVRGVLFRSPNCPHCHTVISETIIPLIEKYGEALQLISADTSKSGGHALYQAAIDAFEIPKERRGVPTLIVGDQVLVGSVEIPERFPGIVEQGLAGEGIDWPDIPGLAEAMAGATESVTTPTDSFTPGPNATSSLLDVRARIARDPLGNSISIVVLCGMVVSVGWVVNQGVCVWRGQCSPSSEALRQAQDEAHLPLWKAWGVPALCTVGLVVAGYLAYVETRQVRAMCGPVGDCNAVQQSEYALLFGVLPIAVLGVVGYVAISATWMWGRFGKGRLAKLAPLALFGLALFGTLFSIYLTFLEPFVIGATCSWCLTSALTMTLILLLATERGWKSLCAQVGV
jgi:uncharacterized membrane protein